MWPSGKKHGKKHLISDLRNHKPDAGTTPGNIVVIDANGLPTEDSLTSLASILGGINIQGAWNATTNVPDLTLPGAKVAGHGYIVTVAGNTNLDGITDWQIKDIAWFDGIALVWRKIDNTQDIHALGGALHSPDSHANLNSKVTDRDLVADATKLDGIESGATKSTFAEQTNIYDVSDTKGNDLSGDGSSFKPFATPLKAIQAGVIAGFGEIFIRLDMSGSGYGAFTIPDNTIVSLFSPGAVFSIGAVVGDITVGVGTVISVNNLSVGKFIERIGFGPVDSADVIIEDCFCDGVKASDGATPSSKISTTVKMANDNATLVIDLMAGPGWTGTVIDGSFVLISWGGFNANGSKIVNVANGTVGDDVAAFGQIGSAISTHAVIPGAHHSRPIQATESALGISEIATQTEVNAGSDDLRFITPLKLKNYPGLKKTQPFGFDALGSTSASYLKHGSIIFLGTTKEGSPTKIQVNAYRVGGTSYGIRIRDITNGLTIAEVTGLTNTVEGIQDLGTISNLPTGQARWELQLIRVGSPVGNIVSSGGLIEW